MMVLQLDVIRAGGMSPVSNSKCLNFITLLVPCRCSQCWADRRVSHWGRDDNLRIAPC